MKLEMDVRKCARKVCQRRKQPIVRIDTINGETYLGFTSGS